MAASGGYDFDFLENDLPSDYECPVCLLVLRDPQMVSCCGRKYCSTCISRISEAAKPCPFCKDPFQCMAEKQLNRRILDLKVRCGKTKLGCDWVGEIRQIENHEATACMYTETLCSLGCGVVIQRQYLEQHEVDECIKRPVESKLLRLTQKLEARLQSLEEKCESQNTKMKQLEDEVCLLKECNDKQRCEIVSLNQVIQKMSSSQQTDLTQSLKAIQGELIRRCFCFSLALSSRDASWVSPSFLSHQNGYVLQLTACMKRYRSVLKSFVRSVFQSGGRPDRYPISLSLNVLPQKVTEVQLDWPVYISVDILVLSNTDVEANAKLVTVTCFKGSPLESTHLPTEEEEDTDEELMIGHANHSFSCRLVVIKIDHGPEPPVTEQDLDYF